MTDFVTLPEPPDGLRWCPRCHGSGRMFPGAEYSRCGLCNGRGAIPANKEHRNAHNR